MRSTLTIGVGAGLGMLWLAMVSADYTVVETGDRVKSVPAAGRYRWLWRAARRRDKLNAQRRMPSYRYEVLRDGKHWLVVAMQNVAKPRG